MIATILESVSPLVTTVSQVLIHSLWQGGLIAVMLSGALLVLRRNDARLRYLACCLALASVLAWCAVTGLYYGVQHQWSASTVPVQLTETQDPVDVHPSPPDISSASGVTSTVSATVVTSLHRWMFPAWILGVVLLSLHHLLGWGRARRMAHRAASRIPDDWKTRFESLCRELRLSRPVRLVSSSVVKAPCVFGWVKPVILMPVSMFSGLNPSEIEMIILHELAHVRRNDLLVNLLQTAAETLLFFNPAVWWISHQIRVEREHCCDDAVVACRHDRLGYARALASLEEWRSIGVGLATAANGAPLLKRVCRILGASSRRERPAGLGIAGMFLFTAVLSVGLVVLGGPAAQEATAETTVVASDGFEPQRGDIQGRWEIETDGNRAQVSMRFKRRGQTGFSLRKRELLDQVNENSKYFTMKRDAGTVHFEGDFEEVDGELYGSGDCYFRANPEYVKEMRNLGFDVDDEDDVYSLFVHDITMDFTRGLIDLGYDRLSLNKLLEARIHDVTPEFVKEMKDLGYGGLSMNKLVEMRIHDADPDFIRGLAEHGYRDLPADKLVEMRIHDADPDFVAGLAKHGYHDLSASKLVEMRIHGADPYYVGALAELGYKDLSPSKIVEMRIHGVTPDYIREFKDLGYTDLSPSKLVEMRIHNVSPRYVQQLAELGYKDLSPSRLVEMCIHDVSPEFIKRLQERGYDDLSPSELIEYKIHRDW